jgi:hypothetical protein
MRLIWGRGVEGVMQTQRGPRMDLRLWGLRVGDGFFGVISFGDGFSIGTCQLEDC